MRITRETLLKLARDAVSERTRQSHDILAAYLCGSLLGEDFLLGDTADIDLVLVHTDQPAVEREIHQLSETIHLDIAHHLQKDYFQARTLRGHPWLGPTINSYLILYDPQHFLDFTQASVRGQFDRPENILKRAQYFVEDARHTWAACLAAKTNPGLYEVSAYLRSIGQAANALAVLSGDPLSERRFLLVFPQRAQALGRLGLYRGLIALLGAMNLAPGALTGWLPAWREAFLSVPLEKAPARLHPGRLAYYQKAFESMLNSPQPQAVLWPFLRTWSLAASLADPGSPAIEGWWQVCEHLGFMGASFEERLEALDAFLDTVEETLEQWAVSQGA
jgi:hypothetical protein